MEVLSRCDNLLKQLPTMDVVKFLLAAPLDGEHSTVKTRHGKSKLSPKEAGRRFKAALSALQGAKSEERKRWRKNLAVELEDVFSMLPAELKNPLRQTVLHRLILTLKETRAKFQRMALAEIVRVSDEDAFFVAGSMPLHFIVSGDGDSFGANCQCVSDDQLVVQMVCGRAEVTVRNVRAIRAAIGRELFPKLPDCPAAWWSRAPGAVNWEKPQQVLVWLLSLLVFSWSGMCDFLCNFSVPRLWRDRC